MTMTFELKVGGSGRIGGFFGRFTGGALRGITQEANRIIAESPDKSADELTDEIYALIREKGQGLGHVQRSDVREAVDQALKNR
jgi:hypothetical protein